MPASRLYRADTGALLATVALGDGLRGKAFLDEISQFCMEAAVSPGLGPTGPLQGYGREANYPTFLNGEYLSSNPIGGPAVVPAYIGVTVFKAIANSWQLGALGVTTYGDVVPTTPARNAANYGGAGAGDNYVPTPAGCTAAARATAAGGAYNVGAGAGNFTFQVIVNGVTYTVTGPAANLAAVTDTEVTDAVNLSLGGGGGAHALLTAGGAARILTIDEGWWNTLNIVAGATSNVIFAGSAALGATVRGAGGPLNDVARQTTGYKPQRRILPLSISIVSAVAANAITVTDAAGILAGNNGLGGTAAGTINYTTGVIDVVYSGVTTTAPRISYKALIPLDYTQQVRVPRSGLDLAILLN